MEPETTGGRRRVGRGEPPGAIVTAAELAALEAAVRRRLPAYIDELRSLVDLDCGSYTKAGVDEAGRRFRGLIEGIGATVEIVPQVELGDIVVARLDGEATRSLLLIGHLDTVFPEGTAAARPFEIRGARAFGPGVTDMKGGLLAGVHALGAIHDALGSWPFRRLVYIGNPDEEIGSPVSTPTIEQEAAIADACLVLECARANGDIVGSRKGILDLRVALYGRAAHAGVEPEKGRSAILAAAALTLELTALNGRWAGGTVNVGVIAGGTRPNVVAERAELRIDVRAVTRADLEALEAEIRRLSTRPPVEDVRTEVELVHRHWPMERLAASERLINHAKTLAGRLGFSIEAAATGGASDANTTAGLGVPTLDGLGPIGGSDHSPDEYLEVESIVPRTTLLAALIVAIARDDVASAAR